VPSFDVQTQQGGNWVTQTTCDDKETAIATAKRLFGNKACTGVRVMQNVTKSDGTIIETEIHCETRVISASEKIKSSQIESAPPPCATVKEFYDLPSRRLMGRVFRDYCDKMVVTPTEILYNIKEASRLQDRGPIVLDAIAKVAALQSAGDPGETKVRSVDLNKQVDAIIARARKAERLALPRLDKSFATAVKAVRSIETQGEDAEYVAMVVLARDLSTVRNWLGKLHRLCKLAEVDKDDQQALALLDGVVADALAGAVVQDILGFQPNLGCALVAMVDLSEGKLVPEKSDAGEAAGIINALCGQGKFPASRYSLLERVHRQLSGGGPLNRADPEKEKDEFKRVMDRLTKPTGLYWGPETAEALTDRYGRLTEKGGKSGKIASFNGVFYLFPDRTNSIHYLCDIASTGYGEDCADAIAEKFDTVTNFRSLPEMFRSSGTVKDRLQRLSSAVKAIAASVFPDQAKTKMTHHLLYLLDRFVTDTQMLEKMDAASVPVKDRALIMAQFCASGILPPGKTLDRFRERLDALIATADFDRKFLEGAPDMDQAQKSLNALKQLMSKKAPG